MHIQKYTTLVEIPEKLTLSINILHFWYGISTLFQTVTWQHMIDPKIFVIFLLVHFDHIFIQIVNFI